VVVFNEGRFAEEGEGSTALVGLRSCPLLSQGFEMGLKSTLVAGGICP
jgi:hypothetical protein